MDAFEESEQEVGAPLSIGAANEVGDSVRGAEVGSKVKVDVDEGDVLERVLQRGLGLGKDEVASADERKPILSGGRRRVSSETCTEAS